jgi:RNA polymerase sigma-70 factor (ECF subfamily)
VDESADIDRWLGELSLDNEGAVNALMPTLYDELRKIAVGHLRRERPDHTLQPTALVNEAYLRLVGQRAVAWQNRAHFLGVAASVMRRILVDHARARGRVKRGGLLARVTFDDMRVGERERDFDVVALDDALRSLAEVDEQLSRIVELRFFGGLTVEETAQAVGVSSATVDRGWATARAWLRRALDHRDPAS